jgi:hypothetical protein
MTATTPIRIARVLMAISVSLWMAGAGCLWGCSKGKAAAAEVSATHEHDSSTVVSGSSCHSKPRTKTKSKQSHDCCPQKSANNTSERTTTPLPVFNAIPEGMMKDCPLAVNASALGNKSSSSSSSNEPIQVADLPNVHSVIQRIDTRSSPVQYLNRGPTYLRCCVFLI